MTDLSWLEALFRWVHVVAGITWIGHLYFFNFVNSQVAKTYDADSKKKVIPELMPRALYWFRWGAAYTWVSGILLAGLVYYGVENLARRDVTTNATAIGHGAAVGISLGLIAVSFFVYEALWNSFGKKSEKVGVVALCAVFLAVLILLSRVFGGRALLIQAGMMMGTVMAMNVWMRIWPAQKKIIQGVKGVAPAPDASVAAGAALRSKHNTYLSAGLVFAMVSNHYPTIFGWEPAWLVAAVVVGLGFAAVKVLYGKAASPAAASFGAPATAPAGGATGAAAPKA
jgi:uncharacterized membrane protein